VSGTAPGYPGAVPTSIWTDTTPTPEHPRLAHDLDVDVAVVGGGMTGMTTALLLAREGAKVAVLEAGRIGGGVTGHTTGKISALQGIVYDELKSKFGVEGAATYAAAQQAGLRRIRELVAELGIDCDLRDRPNFTYAAEESQVSDVEAEAEAAREAGLPVELVDDVALPYPVRKAVRLGDSAEFHARKFVLGLADAFLAAGGEIYEQTPITTLRERGGPSLEAEGGQRVDARDVIVATLMPVFDRAVYWTRLTAKRSYAIACRVTGGVPPGMYITAGSPTRSIRAIPVDGEELLMVGGEGHNTGEDDDTRERYAALEAFAREHWDVDEVTHRWSAQDLQPADGVPYIGRYTPISRHVWTAAGFRKWGFTNGAMAAELLTAMVQGREHEWADFFDPYRFTPLRSAKGVAMEVLKDGRHFVGDRLRGAEADSFDEVPPGEARLVRDGLKLVGAFRDDDGTLKTVNPTCTHVGCRLGWNTAERSWDCPCHGSRFAPDGTVLQGPATAPLERLD
jgi:glycine/D-amino acid oxidase-like deaminating enzyme/nitrite reductase/ring-hydroxylating ferredoxin subunit